MRALYILPSTLGGPPGPPALRCRRIGRYRYRVSRLWRHGWLQLHDCHAVDGAALREMVAGEVLPWLEERQPGRAWIIGVVVDSAGQMIVSVTEGGA